MNACGENNLFKCLRREIDYLENERIHHNENKRQMKIIQKIKFLINLFETEMGVDTYDKLFKGVNNDNGIQHLYETDELKGTIDLKQKLEDVSKNENNVWK